VNSLRTHLSADNFGEWLAALGLLRVAAVLDPKAALAFSENGEALLFTEANEETIVAKLLKAAAPALIRLEYLVKADEPGTNSVRVGDLFFDKVSHRLSENIRAFLESEDSKKGCLLELTALDGLKISHFSGSARSEEADLRSPVIFWAGMVTFQGILSRVVSKLGGLKATSFEEVFKLTTRETQRFRFDHTGEQFIDDGAHDSAAGRASRPGVEWCALLGISFFSATAGFESLSPKRRLLVSRVWREPLDSLQALIALHSGQAPIRRHFYAEDDGKMKKLRSITNPQQNP